MARYLIEDFNTHCTYDFYDESDAYEKYKKLKRESPNPAIVMTMFIPDYKHSTIVKRILESTI